MLSYTQHDIGHLTFFTVVWTEQPQEEFLQPKGHQRLEQSSSKCCRCNFGQLIQEPSRCLLEDHWIWTIKAQPTEVHNITSTSTSSALNHHNNVGAENSLFVPQFLGAEKLGRQCQYTTCPRLLPNGIVARPGNRTRVPELEFWVR